VRTTLRLLALTIVGIAPGALAGQEFPVLADDAPAGSGEVRDCPIAGVEGTVRCGRFRVFEDREAAAGRTLDIAFVILGALDAESAPGEVIVSLPGGPGQSFTPAAAGVARFEKEFRTDRDILLVDVRGVGRSQALGCPDFEIPTADRFGTMFPPEHIRRCRAELEKRARLHLYTTNYSVDDLDELIRWLGYDAIDLTGGSYGTRVAQIYMRRHPESIRTVILNSVVPVFEHGYVYMARSLQRSLDLVVAGCGAEPSCAADNPDLRVRLDSVLARLDRGPVELEVDGARVGFTKGDFSYALRGLLYGRAEDVPPRIERAWEGDYQRLASYYLERTSWLAGADGEAGYHFSALCAEDIAPLTDDEVARLTAGTFMGDHLIAGYRQACGLWDVAELPASFWEPVRSDLPVLVISGERDPVTPPQWGEAVASYLPNSLHVIVPGGGHGPSNPCTGRLEMAFLDAATVEGLDTSCIGSTAASEELRAMYEADQADREGAMAASPERWQEITERDHARRDRVLELVREGALFTAEDYYDAAMVLQHGEGSEDILVSHILSTIAGFKGDERGRWLSAAALDRYLHRTDQPQRLGTQYVRDSADVPWSQGAYEDWLPDSVRREFGVATREEQRERVRRMNPPAAADPPSPDP